DYYLTVNMDKRSFIKSLGLGLASIPVFGHANVLARSQQTQQLLKANALKSGATIGLITPASAVVDEASIARSREVLEYLGFRVVEGKYIRERYGNLAGTDEQRLEDLHGMFSDTSVDGIL